MNFKLKAILFFIFMFFTKLSLAQDPMVAASNVYQKVLLENEKIRVIEIVFEIGETAPQHSHPEHFVYALTAGKLKITNSEGKTIEADIKAGDALMLPAETHTATNIGSTECRLIVTELKK
jgi:quercetin dioxygenase-like cupin family protein